MSPTPSPHWLMLPNLDRFHLNKGKQIVVTNYLVEVYKQIPGKLYNFNSNVKEITRLTYVKDYVIRQITKMNLVSQYWKETNGLVLRSICGFSVSFPVQNTNFLSIS